MNTKFIDRTGVRYGKLTAVARVGTNHLKKVLWECKCDCGNTTIVPSGALATGNTASCGCGVKEAITKHGGTGKGSYNTWRAMMRRCYNPKDKDYSRYGAIGVRVCPEWHEYLAFAKAMGEPIGSETLDRIDPYGNYEPNNCRWASLPTQARNIRVPASSKSGHIGVHQRGKKWMAEITAGGKKYYSRVYESLEDAVAARKELERVHWGTG